MAHEEVFDWIIKVMNVCLWVCGVTASIVICGLFSGFVSEKYVQYQRTENCINSACDQPCKAGARFVRHQGCVK